MPLETATYIGSLVSSNPASSDIQAQGDDHLRLIKAALQSTFPNATKAFYFPTTQSLSASAALIASAANNDVFVDCSGGNRTITLPTLATGDAGWSVNIYKVDTSTSILTVAPASGLINGSSNISTRIPFSGFRVVWSGTAWYAHTIGERKIPGEIAWMCHANPNAGWLYANGAAVSRTTYAALFAHISTFYGTGDGSTTFNIPDLRHRVVAGTTDGTGRLGTDVLNGMAGTGLGAVGGLYYHQLTALELAAHTHGVSGTTSGQSNTHTHNYTSQQHNNSISVTDNGSDQTLVADNNYSGYTTDGASADHTHTFSVTSGSTGSNHSHNNVQPTILMQPYIWSGRYA